MPDPELTKLKAALRRAWPDKPSAKAQNYRPLPRALA